jgi:hypothetical protein
LIQSAGDICSIRTRLRAALPVPTIAN